jgi:hypothetical protein
LLGLLALRRDKNPAERGTSEGIATGRYPHVKYRPESSGSVSGAGTRLLTETARALRLVEALDRA